MRRKPVMAVLLLLALSGCATRNGDLRNPVLFMWFLDARDAEPSWTLQIDRKGNVLERIQYENNQDWHVRRGRVDRKKVEALLSQADRLRFVKGDELLFPSFGLNRMNGKELTILVYGQGQPCQSLEVEELAAFYKSVIPVLPEQVSNQVFPSCSVAQ